MNIRERTLKAKEFSEYWKDKGYEKGQSQVFWMQLLKDIFEVENISSFIEFENQVHIDKSTGFIDAYIPSTKVLIEQKSIDKDLRKAIKQSAGNLLTPFQQAKKYIAELPVSKHPRYVVTCNFKSFLIYDMEKPNGEPYEVLLENLETEYYRLQFLVNVGNEHLKKEMEVSIKAGDLVGKLYDLFLNQYIDKTNEESLKSLNKLCVRLVFCLYAEDAGLFGKKNVFHDYLARFDTTQIRSKLIELFKILDTPESERDPYLDEDLQQFPYVNGGLFSDENIEIPTFTEEIKNVLLSKASDEFDWSQISPTIFGAVFESSLNPDTRRSGGMHYTSIENIHKVIDPLFLNDIKEELEDIKNKYKNQKTRNDKLLELQDKISSLKFLDPACGSGNFLTETYLSLRKIENEIIEIINKGQVVLDTGNLIKVNIHQFYGIEINDFAVTVAKTALWIAESQMMIKTSEIVHTNLDFLPLKKYVNIIEANALRIDWNDIISNLECSYIMGNPPFIGARLLDSNQRKDVELVFHNWKNSGNLDYVSCWFKKCCDYMKNTDIKSALVSTSSIIEGEAIGLLWKKIMEDKLLINFAYRPFKWNSEAKDKAQVYCVIIGFSFVNGSQKIIFSDEIVNIVRNINPYLMDAPNLFIERRNTPVCNSPKMHKGCQPTDGGNLIIEEDEYKEFINKEPNAKKYIKNLIGAKEFLQNKKRYCLWLINIEPTELKSMPLVVERVKKCKEMRLKANDEGTRKLAERATEFRETYNYKNYIVVPMVTPSNKKYIPMGFFDENTISTNLNLIVENGTLYDFGILESNVHMAWMRIICGRLGDAYRYSAGVVYNNYPWPNPTNEQRGKIEKTAQAILDARAKYPNSSLADLYDELTMPVELRKAHQENDKAVMEAYGFNWRTMTESECVAELMKMYQRLTGEDKVYENKINEILKPYLGMTQLDIYNKLNSSQPLNGIPKNIGQMVTDLIFERSGVDKKEITIKNLPVDSNFEPLERMTFRTIKLDEFKKEWEESEWKKYFENLKMYIICYEGSNEIRNGNRTLKGLKVIEFDKDDLESLKITYNMVKSAIENRDIKLLPYPSSYENQYLEIAPKGAGGVDAYNNFLKDNQTKICFVLNKKFLEYKLKDKKLEHNKRIEKMDISLNKIIYELEEIKLIFDKENEEEISKDLEESDYIIKGKYVIKSDLANNIELKDNGNVLKFNEESINYSNIKKYLDGECKKRNLYKISDYIYITSEKLEQLGITQKDIEESLNKIETTYKEKDYFSIENIFENDYMERYDNLGFAKDMFEYLLIDKKINYIIIGDYKLYSFNSEANINKLFDKIVLNYRILTMNDIKKIIYSDYKIEIPIQRIRKYITTMDFYFNDILDKVYVDKNDYYKEVYNEE